MAVTAPDGYATGKKTPPKPVYQSYYINPGKAYTEASKGVTVTAPKVDQTDPRITQRATTSTGTVIPTSAKTTPTVNNNTGVYDPPASVPVNTGYNAMDGYFDRVVSWYDDMLAEEKARQEKLRQERIDAANRIKEQRIAAANTVYDTSKANLDTARNSSLRQAYIKHMQDSRALPQQMQAYGISGGASETTLANLNNAYGTNRTNIQNEALAQQRYIEQDRANAIAGAEADAANAAVDAYGDAANYEASAVREYNGGLMDMYASAVKNYRPVTGTSNTGSIRNNQWYKQATSLLEDGNSRDEVIAYLDQNGVSEEIIDAILNDWDSSF